MKIAIDPGHGMGNTLHGVYDPGAEANGYKEASITLLLALTLKYVLTEEGIACLILRQDDSLSYPLTGRVARANAAECSHYLALHLNDSDDAAVTGAEAYYRSAEDRLFARAVLNNATWAFALEDRGVKSEGESQHSRLAVFNFDGPATLLECGFISNKNDLSQVLSRQRRIKFSEFVAAYLVGQEENNG